MTNILIKKWLEAEVETKTSLLGQWKIEIVHPNGAVEKPFGDKLRNNLITNRGIDLMMGRTSSAPNYKTGVPQAYIIPNIIRQAAYGGDSTPPSVTDTDLNVGRVLTSDPDGNTVGASDTSSTQTCTVEYNTIQGFARFVRIYDFPAVTGATSVQDIGIYSQNDNNARNLFSRMLLPELITLQANQFIRLTYSLTVSIPALITGIPINVSNNGFDGAGQLKLVGSYQNIFGTMSNLGVPNYALVDSAHDRRGGWLLNGSVTTGVTNRTTAHMVPTSVDFPSPNTPFTFSQVGSTINSSSAGMIFGAYSAGSGEQDITYLFLASNPAASTNLGGVIFCSVIDSNQVLTNPRYGWYWKFNTSQQKAGNFSLAINARQSVSRA